MNEEVEIFTYVTKGSFDANMWEKIKNKATIIAQAMSGNVVQRKIEDMDVSVLSYAEAEALASGNPLMAEKTMVDADVIKYSTLQNEFYKRLRYNERQISKLPDEIAKNQAAIEKIQYDIDNRKPIAGDYFTIKLGDKCYTKRVEAEEALENITKAMLMSTMQDIGEMGGFKLRVHKGYLENKVHIVGQYTYEAKSDSIRSIEYALMNAPAAYLLSRSESLKKMQKDYEDLQAEIKKPFEYQSKLEGLLIRQNEINQEIELAVEQIEGHSPISALPPAQEENHFDAEKIYQSYINKLAIERPYLLGKSLDRYIIKSLNKEGYNEQAIKKCLSYSKEIKDLLPDKRERRINMLLEGLNMSCAM